MKYVASMTIYSLRLTYKLCNNFSTNFHNSVLISHHFKNTIGMYSILFQFNCCLILPIQKVARFNGNIFMLVSKHRAVIIFNRLSQNDVNAVRSSRENHLRDTGRYGMYLVGYSNDRTIVAHGKFCLFLISRPKNLVTFLKYLSTFLKYLSTMISTKIPNLTHLVSNLEPEVQI